MHKVKTEPQVTSVLRLLKMTPICKVNKYHLSFDISQSLKFRLRYDMV
jgi:hypothetical protein